MYVAGVQPEVVLPAAAGELLPPVPPQQQPAPTGQGGQTGRLSILVTSEGLHLLLYQRIQRCIIDKVLQGQNPKNQNVRQTWLPPYHPPHPMLM